MFPWQQAARVFNRGGGAATAEAEPVQQACPNVAKFLDKFAARESRPAVLDLGSMCGPTAVFLAERGAQVTVDGFEAPPAPDPASDAPTAPLSVPYEDGKFDLVLAWQHPDFVAPKRLAELYAELYRVMAEGACLIFFAEDQPSREPGSPDHGMRYRLLEDRLLLEPVGPERPRWSHPTRAIERALSPMSVQNIHLRANRVREFVVIKKKPKPKA